MSDEPSLRAPGNVRSEIYALTSKGAIIATFDDMDRARAWAETEGKRFSGWEVVVQTTRTITTTAVVLWDDSAEVAA